MATAGTISARYFATCGLCGGIQNFRGLGEHQAREAAKKSGWRFQGDDGWVCPVCIEETPSAPART